MECRVGFVGLGSMGSLMAANIARAGFPLWIFNRTQSKAADLAKETGARVADSPVQVAENCDVLLTMVSDANALREIYFGPAGFAQGLRPNTVCVDMSTVGPTAIRRLGEDLKPLSVGLLDAPVSGSIGSAKEAKLMMMVGGDSDNLERVRPVLSTMAARIFHLGKLGAGATMKLAVNAVVYGLNQALAEGLVLAESAGINRQVAYDLFENSAVAAPFVHYRKEAFLKEREVPVGFSLDLARKDLDLIESLAREVHASMPQTAMNRRMIESALEDGRGSQDVSAIAEYLRHSNKNAHRD
jgi:3-hydroxyisobutyrate dehydrogenase-like beta-hydroxyacid dehydrogenase